MTKLVKFLLVGIIAVAAASCGGGSSSKNGSPADIEKKLYSYFQKGEYEKGMKFYFDHSTIEKTEEHEEIMSLFSVKAKESMEKKGGIEKFEVIEEMIYEEEGTAIVVSKVTYGDGTEDETATKFTNVDGIWRINPAGK